MLVAIIPDFDEIVKTTKNIKKIAGDQHKKEKNLAGARNDADKKSKEFNTFTEDKAKVLFSMTLYLL